MPDDDDDNDYNNANDFTMYELNVTQYTQCIFIVSDYQCLYDKVACTCGSYDVKWILT